MSRPDASTIDPRAASARRGLSRGVRSSARRAGAITLRSPEEIEAMRNAGAVVAAALQAAREACVVGATTANIDAAALGVIKAHGASALFLGYPSADGSPAFPACTCISVNDEIVHGIPGDRTIRDGDLVSIDCGVKLAGWCSDSAITVPVGSVKPELLGLLATAESMLATAIRMATPGVAWSEIAEAMQSITLDAGHGLVVEYVGHGIGRSLHESPQVPNCLTRSLVEQDDFTLRPGMVLAIEPMITLHGVARDPSDCLDHEGYPIGIETSRLGDGWTVVAADGSPAVHVEHTVAITRRGCDVLSTLPSASSKAGRTLTA